ncbi:MAG: M23 family metallopeptidase [Parvibaculum sp.]|nr:M23 family metallopeptidase [Parvibaculum sp.]
MRQITGLVLICLVLAGCATRSDNWWDENGAARSGDGRYVEGTPLPPPNRYGSSSGSGGTYIVKKGETLYQVSREQNVPIRSLIDANNLNAPYDLRAGQRLKIPSARYHVVVPGDTVYSISRTYGVDMSTLTTTNHIPQPYTIKVGQRLQLPSKVNNQVAAAVDEQSQSRPSGVPIRRPDSEYTSSAARPTAASGGNKAPLPAPPVPAGDFIWPVQGKILSAYGAKEGGTHNDGINIAVPAGAPVKASQNGVVAYAGNELKGYGNLLLVRHANGWMTAYAHNSKLLVKRGDTVKRGQTISQAGSTGSVTSPQVHFEVRKGAKAVDPRSVIGS